MSDLFTVKMFKEHRVSRYDTDGRLIAAEVRKIPIVFCDLPYATAVMYQTKFPDAGVTIEKQAYNNDRALRDKVGGVATRREFKRHHQTQEGVPPADLGSEDLSLAARTGDMAAAINAEIEAGS